MDRKIYVVFVAGGHGTRMGSALPKQFLELGGKTILEQTIAKFLHCLPGMKIVTVLPKEYFSTWKDICKKALFSEPQILVEGGFTRFHSVKAALERVPDDAVVLIHDAVRPLAGEKLIRELLEQSADCPAVIPVTPITDTLKSLEETDDGEILPTGKPDPSRTNLFGAQTPQVFDAATIKKAYTQAFDPAFTDDASVARKAGVPVRYIHGEKYNIKITTPEDLETARLLFKEAD